MNTENAISATEAFASLTPDTILDAVEASGMQCDGRFLALNSYENRVYQIGVENGPAVVAKFYRPERWSDEAIIEEHRFTLELAEEEIPAIAPVIDNHGNTLHHHGHHRYALYPRRGGRAPELDDPDTLKQLGRLIGRIHAYSSSRPFTHRSHLDIESLAIQPRSFLLEQHFIPDHLIPAYQTITRDLISHIEQHFTEAGHIRYIRLHGDCHPGNILWTDDGPHVVDFDDARMGPAVQDLWMFLSGDRDYMTRRLGDLLEGYSQFYDFRPAELKLVEALRTLRIIHYAYWIASRWHDPAFPRAFPWFNSSRYWEDHVLSLREQAALLNEEPLRWD